MPTWVLPKDIQLLFKMWDIRMQQGMEFPNNYNQFKIDCMKSALLQRLLRGEEPLEFPPPRAHSYPWYELIEDGYGCPFEVWQSDGAFFGKDVIVIDQCAWKLIEVLGDKEWIATYSIRREPDWNNLEHFSKDKWHIYAVACRYPPMKDHDSTNFYWYMERIEKN